MPTQDESDPAASATPTQLTAETVAWLADHPRARTVVSSVWDKLAELERAGHHPDTLAALRSVLTSHQPTPAGRCRTCRGRTWRHLWRSRPFPCVVWHQIRRELLGVFASSSGRHRQPAMGVDPGTASPSR